MEKQKPIAWLFKATRHDGTTSESVAFTSATASVGHTEKDGYVSWWTVPLFCAPRWIPVTEAMPDKDAGVLLSDGDWVTYGWLQNDREWKVPVLIRGTWIYSHQEWEAMTGLVELSRFTHWMPLPAPPADGR